MKPASISLLEYFATDLVLGTNHAFASDKPVQFDDKEFIVDVAAKQNDKAPRTGNRWQVTLDVRHQPAPGVNFPYSYRVVMVGQFGVSDNVKPEDEERFVRIHGASVLYGMAREIVRALTGRGPYRSVIIPTVSFYEQKPAVGKPVVAEPAKVSATSAGKRVRKTAAKN